MLSNEVYLRNAQAFAGFNQRRLEQVRECLPERKREVFDLIPYLLHEESLELPGCKDARNVPAGIFCYEASAAVKELARRHFPRHTARNRAKPALVVKFLALMGSAGTVAFTPESHLDYWVGVEENALDLDAQLLLRAKLAAMERWAQETANFETHFFIVDIAKIRRDDHGSLMHKSCGTALGVLLKDEFYRTGLFVAGKKPFYWLMPAGIKEADYTFAVARLCENAGFPHGDYVDLGFIRAIGFSEHFGAMLWQLLKGLRSPFASVLKIALIDKYCAEGVRALPLCEQFKSRVQTFTRGESPDPYLFLIDELRAFYDGQHLASVRQLLEQCFLVRCLLSAGGRESQQTDAFMRLGKLWGWSDDSMADFAQYREWDRLQRDDFHRRIIGFMIDAYRRVRARTHGESARIFSRDLTIVGKKLKSFLEPEPEKVPYEFSFFTTRDVAAIRLYQQTSDTGAPSWFAGVRLRGVGAAQYHLTREVYNPIAGCAWCSRNGFFHPKAVLTISGATTLSVKEAVALIEALDAFFPCEEAEDIDVQELLDEEYVSHLFIIPNWDRPEWSAGLASSLALLRTTSGEMFVAQHAGVGGEKWLTDEIILKRVGRKHLSALAWKVHLLRGDVSSTRRVSESLAQRIRRLTAGDGR